MNSTDSSRVNQNWFHIRYSDGTGAGLPPVVQAERIVRFSDNSGTWLAALWESEQRTDMAISACILRVPAEDVAAVSQHEDMASAVNQMLFG